MSLASRWPKSLDSSINHLWRIVPSTLGTHYTWVGTPPKHGQSSGPSVRVFGAPCHRLNHDLPGSVLGSVYECTGTLLARCFLVTFVRCPEETNKQPTSFESGTWQSDQLVGSPNSPTLEGPGIRSMYAIYAYIKPSNHPNVGIYTIHGGSWSPDSYDASRPAGLGLAMCRKSSNPSWSKDAESRRYPYPIDVQKIERSV